MTPSSRRVSGALSLTAALALGLAACSSPGPDDADAAPASSATATAEASGPTPTASDTVDPGAGGLDAQQEALDALVAEAQPAIPSLHEAYPGLYSDITITADGPSTLVYAYVYSDEASSGGSVEEMRQAMAEVDPMLQEGCDTQVFPAMTAAGVTVDPKVRYVYTVPSGEEVWSYTCEPSA